MEMEIIRISRCSPSVDLVLVVRQFLPGVPVSLAAVWAVGCSKWVLTVNDVCTGPGPFKNVIGLCYQYPTAHFLLSTSSTWVAQSV